MRLTLVGVSPHTAADERVEEHLLSEQGQDLGDFTGVCEGDGLDHETRQLSRPIYTIQEVAVLLVRQRLQGKVKFIISC